ncbi:Protein CASC1 [Holothuria leucospilota]|uniref:Protein CASC1 n=1 Tax=Holothuria leucospilota TaxID=206669 RepID=A0A9Q0YKA1_HOLLE|nr:Protein CASC1 [Holothuria leucospilota]
MPPKPKSPTKGKKGKLSKAEKERLKKEELERKAKEEEDARLKAEQEERERLERERLEREERERIEAAESQRYTTEINELRSVLEGNKNALANLLEQEREKTKWSRFMRCDGSPDPTVPAEINTYINLWKEDDSRNSLSAVLSESNLTLGLIEELQQYVEDHDDTEFTNDHLAEHEGTIVELENLLSCKLDAATLELLKPWE